MAEAVRRPRSARTPRSPGPPRPPRCGRRPGPRAATAGSRTCRNICHGRGAEDLAGVPVADGDGEHRRHRGDPDEEEDRRGDQRDLRALRRGRTCSGRPAAGPASGRRRARPASVRARRGRRESEPISRPSAYPVTVPIAYPPSTRLSVAHTSGHRSPSAARSQPSDEDRGRRRVDAVVDPRPGRRPAATAGPGRAARRRRARVRGRGACGGCGRGAAPAGPAVCTRTVPPSVVLPSGRSSSCRDHLVAAYLAPQQIPQLALQRGEFGRRADVAGARPGERRAALGDDAARPGADITSTRSPSTIASSRLWVMKSVVVRVVWVRSRSSSWRIVAQLGVERRERLVHQQDLGFHGERAGDRDALAHAAGQRGRIGVGEVGEAHPGEPVACRWRRPRGAGRCWMSRPKRTLARTVFQS